MIVDDVMTDKITLHGLGFVQVQLPASQRLHVWHPELPRRHCFEHSAIHNHRFGFQSRVLVGQQININFSDFWPGSVAFEEPTHDLYLHEGPRTPRGGRPWTPDGQVRMVETSRDTIAAGGCYTMRAYEFHRTEPGGDGRVATIMTKLWEGQRGAHSSCAIGVEPDGDFDRYQWSPAQLWEIVSDVLTGSMRP
ncbi:hypothetical protein [Ectopseudomonas toyotomiensis]|uniref:Uncharacterized protein n=1 Tax=Ectopseudomonas toyotomiensis TaxID=554344 RepID=A0AA42LG87_9GAMM|nr:hypothetical protein [Pseudomonas toyotomiensis]MBG0838990.1 hypothetical protein [Pseudomonas toyotomiensis]MDH0699934.1 hypothetical protein [Pseudomonas toyotomiensis]